MNKLDKAIFLDRDGTINVDNHHVFRIDEFEFIEKTAESISIFKALGFKVIVVTNQSGVAKGLYSELDVLKLHQHINKVLSKIDVKIDAFYYCPHHPLGVIKQYSTDCDCRKPKPGMILKALSEHNIDGDKSILIGDNETDILAGKKAKIGLNYLVKSGNKIHDDITEADLVFESVYDVAKYLKEAFRTI